MPLPASREQIRKLGERLATSDPVCDDDARALEELIACHLQILELARPRLRGLAETVGVDPVHVAYRAKTTKTIIEKLRRHGDMNLARMQDLAGIRVVGSFTLTDQDRLAAEISRRFPADPRGPKIIDRRTSPSYGYRAVHIVVSLDGVTVEVQVRTIVQHMWADLMERIADRLGRQIRYGEPPAPPAGMSQESAQNIIDTMMSISDSWAAAAPPMPEEAALYLDTVTEAAWDAVSDALRLSGIDL